MYILFKVIWGFNIISIKILTVFFIDKENKLRKFIWNHTHTKITKAILRKKNRARNTKLPDCKIYFKATVIKMIWSWHKDILTNGTEEVTQKYAHTSMVKWPLIGHQEHKMKKDNFVNKRCWKNWILNV